MICANKESIFRDENRVGEREAFLMYTEAVMDGQGRDYPADKYNRGLHALYMIKRQMRSTGNAAFSLCTTPRLAHLPLVGKIDGSEGDLG